MRVKNFKAAIQDRYVVNVHEGYGTWFRQSERNPENTIVFLEKKSLGPTIGRPQYFKATFTKEYWEQFKAVLAPGVDFNSLQINGEFPLKGFGQRVYNSAEVDPLQQWSNFFVWSADAQVDEEGNVVTYREIGAEEMQARVSRRAESLLRSEERKKALAVRLAQIAEAKAAAAGAVKGAPAN